MTLPDSCVRTKRRKTHRQWRMETGTIFMACWICKRAIDTQWVTWLKSLAERCECTVEEQQRRKEAVTMKERRRTVEEHRVTAYVGGWWNGELDFQEHTINNDMVTFLKIFSITFIMFYRSVSWPFLSHSTYFITK